MENLGELKGKKNPKTQQVFFVSEQTPDGILETRRQLSAKLKNFKDANDLKRKEQKQKSPCDTG